MGEMAFGLIARFPELEFIFQSFMQTCRKEPGMNMALEEEIFRFLQKPNQEKFEAVALKLYEHQKKQCLVYARYCESLEQSEPIDSWKKIPAVPQQAFKY